MDIEAAPLTYDGVRFRASLEADWAATLDALGIHWRYRPARLRLPSGQVYAPDFYLPALNAWAEVKGPHRRRALKAVEPTDTLDVGGAGWWEQVHVIILEAAGHSDTANWHVPRAGRDCWLVECGERQNRFSWYDGTCWSCHRQDAGGLHYFYRPASSDSPGLSAWRMTRAPRPDHARQAA